MVADARTFKAFGRPVAGPCTYLFTAVAETAESVADKKLIDVQRRVAKLGTLATRVKGALLERNKKPVVPPETIDKLARLGDDKKGDHFVSQETLGAASLARVNRNIAQKPRLR